MGAKIQAGLRIWAVKVRLAGVWLGGAISKWNGHRPFGHFLGPSWTSPGRFGGQGKQVQAFRPLLGPTLGAGQGLSATSWAHLWGAGRTSPGLSATSWAYLGERGKQVQIRVIEPFRIASRCGTLQPNRPARAIEPFRRASRPGTLQSSYGGKNTSRPVNLGCKGASCRGVVGRCHKQMEWAQAFRPLLGSILDKSRPFGHFLGPP